MNHLSRSVLITGASSGIGEFLAYEFASHGYHLALCARRIDRLHQVAERCRALNPLIQILVLETDVTKPESLNRSVAECLSKFGSLDIVIANAGFGVAGAFEKLKLEDFQRQFQTNVDGVLNTIYSSLSAIKKSQGSLVLIGSINSYVSQPKKAPYCMSKFAIRALAESLYVELKPQGVAVTLVCPGMVESEIRLVDNNQKLHIENSAKPPSWMVMPTKKAAQQIFHAISKRERGFYPKRYS
jgi:short-subunit dehydrogenase